VSGGVLDELNAIDAAVLTPIVRSALGRDAAVVEWRYAPFGHSLDEVYQRPTSIVKFTGTARAGTSIVPWTVVLKIVRAPATPEDPSSPENGEREPLAYASGILDGGAGLRAPRCFGVETRSDGVSWLWLEEIVDDIGREWPIDRYVLAARHLGRFNGAHPAERGDLGFAWLSRSPLAAAVDEMKPRVARIRGARGNPFVNQAVSSESADALLALVEKSGAWLEELERLPQTICHWDAHRANLMSRTTDEGEVQTIAIDWAGVGWGPVGSELSKLLSQTVNFFGLPVDALPALDARLFDEYVRGLRESGWRGEDAMVRFGYTAAAAMRLIVRTALALDLAFDARAREAYERATGLEFAALADRFRRSLPYYLSLVEEAGRLAR